MALGWLNKLVGKNTATAGSPVKLPLYEYRDIWAEESGGLSNNNAQYSYGNGAVGFMGLPIDAGWEVVAMGFNADVYPANGQVQVDLMSYNTPSNAATNTIASVNLTSATDGGGTTNNPFKYFVLPTPAPIPSGLIGFITRTEVGAVTDARAYARLRRYIGDYVSDIPSLTVGGSVSSDFDNLVSLPVNSNTTILPLPAAGVTGYRFDNVTILNNVVGMEAANNGDMYLFFITNDNEIDFVHDSAAAPLGQRFYLPNRQQFDFKEFSSVYVRYDSSLGGGSGGWHLVAPTND